MIADVEFQSQNQNVLKIQPLKNENSNATDSDLNILQTFNVTNNSEEKLFSPTEEERILARQRFWEHVIGTVRNVPLPYIVLNNNNIDLVAHKATLQANATIEAIKDMKDLLR